MKNDKKHLLVVEDDKGLQSQLRWAFDGFEVTISGDRTEAINQLRRVQPGVVLLDLGLPPDPGGVTEGLATLREILSLIPETKVIVVTGDNDRSNAVKAIALGAYDFHQKPADPELLALLVDQTGYARCRLDWEQDAPLCFALQVVHHLRGAPAQHLQISGAVILLLRTQGSPHPISPYGQRQIIF